MKRAIILTIVLVGLTGVIAAEKQTDLQKENLFRKVKSVTETTYNVKESFGELILNGVAGSRINNMYNSMGNLTEKSFTYYGRLYDNILYTYDERDNLIEEAYYTPNGSPLSKYLYAADDREGSERIAPMGPHVVGKFLDKNYEGLKLIWILTIDKIIAPTTNTSIMIPTILKILSDIPTKSCPQLGHVFAVLLTSFPQIGQLKVLEG